MFEKFNFSKKQIETYYKSAIKDYKIAKDSDVPEVVFHFCYNSLIKLAISICSENSLRVKSRQGHHIELIEKLSKYLDDEEILTIGNEMRSKRNWDLYGGGIIISKKSAQEYLLWVKNILNKSQKYLDDKNSKLKLNI